MEKSNLDKVKGKNNDILGNGVLFTMAGTPGAWDGESDKARKTSRAGQGGSQPVSS